MPLDPRDPRILDAFAEICQAMQQDAASGRWWEGSHAEEFARRAHAKLAEIGEPVTVPLVPETQGAALNRIAAALERCASALERGAA